MKQIKSVASKWQNDSGLQESWLSANYCTQYSPLFLKSKFMNSDRTSYRPECHEGLQFSEVLKVQNLTGALTQVF